MRTSATEVALRIYLQAAQVRVNVNGSDIATSGGNALNNDVWYHLVIQRTGTSLKIYSNGVEIGTGTDSSNFATKPIRVGMDYNGANGFTGYIDELLALIAGVWTSPWNTTFP